MTESFEDATARPYGYLLCDLKPETPNDFRLRTNIFPGETQYAYVKKNIKKETKIYIKQLNMSQRLRRNHDFLKLLAKCTPAQRKAILKVADDNLIKTICECVLNVLEKTVPTGRAVKKRLFPHKKALSTLVHKGTPIERKKKILIQHEGNFLGVLLPPVLRVLSSLLT